MMRDTTETEFDVNDATYRLVLSTLARQRTQLGPTATGFHITSSFFFVQHKCGVCLVFLFRIVGWSFAERSTLGRLLLCVRSGRVRTCWECWEYFNTYQVDTTKYNKQHRDYERASGLSEMAGAGESERDDCWGYGDYAFLLFIYDLLTLSKPILWSRLATGECRGMSCIVRNGSRITGITDALAITSTRDRLIELTGYRYSLTAVREAIALAKQISVAIWNSSWW